MSKKVLLVGLSADAVDYKKWPELSRDELENSFRETSAILIMEGYTPIWCLLDRGEMASEMVSRSLDIEQPDIVMLGAGMRTDDDLFYLFEGIINLVHSFAPQAHIAFNRDLLDTVEAVRRCETCCVV